MADTSVIFNILAKDKTAAGVGSAEQRLKNAQKSISTAALLAGGAIAGGFGIAAKKTIDFEKQISAIAAVSNASGAELNALRQQALKLGADTSFSATGAAQAMEELAKAGVSTKDILNGASQATVALAAAGGVELPEAANLAANAMNAYNLKATDLGRVTDLIAGAANASAIDVGEFGFSLQQVGAVAHLTGISFDDTAVAIAELGNAGIKGSDAGTSLKTMLMNLTPNSKAAREAMMDLGIITKSGANQFFDAKGKAKSLSDISQILQNSLKGQSKEQKLATLNTLFGSDAIRAAAVLTDQGAKGFDNLAASMAKTKAADVAKARLNNTAGQIEQLKGSLETLSIAFGEFLIPSLTKLAGMLTNVVNWFNGLSETSKKVILITGLVAGGLIALVLAVSKVIEFIKIARTVWTALNLAFVATPIGLIITGIVLLVAAFVILWLKCAAFRNFWISVWGAIWGFLKAVGAWFAGPFAGFFVSGFNMVKNGVISAKNFVVNTFNSLVSFFKGIPGRIASIAKGMFNGIVNAFRGAINAIIGKWNNLSFTIGGGSFLGVSIPSLSLGTPDIPYMAAGGTIVRSGMAVVGDHGPELLSLNRGAQVQPLGRGGTQKIQVESTVRFEGNTDSAFASQFMKLQKTGQIKILSQVVI